MRIGKECVLLHSGELSKPFNVHLRAGDAFFGLITGLPDSRIKLMGEGCDRCRKTSNDVLMTSFGLNISLASLNSPSKIYCSSCKLL